jgi:4-hydroxythreonine-4-phosphate dehydrogenase
MLESGKGSEADSGGANLPRIGVTMGDAAGIGPEIILKALSDEKLSKICRPVVIGDLAYLRKSADGLGVNIELSEFGPASVFRDGRVYVSDCRNLQPDVAVGRETAEVGRAAAQYIEKSVELWRDGVIEAVATAPINKRSIHLGGYNFPGHTEFLAELTQTKRFAMSFFAEKLRVVLLTTHISLTDAISRVRTDALVDLIRFSDEQLAKLLNRKIKLAVAGLNPHASEGGMFGVEEASEIAPAVRLCRDEYKIDVSGPYSPDTIFLRGFRGEFDGVIACYHDQATIAVKALSFGSSVNVTLGLPLIRTSVDHGTAFDIAGRGVADASSMKAAIILAAELAFARRQAHKSHESLKLGGEN